MTDRTRLQATPRRVIHVLSLFAILALVGNTTCNLTRRPAVGLADNGDFWRVMYPAGIDHLEPLGDEHHAFVRRTFRLVDVDFRSNPSSPAVVALLAKHIGWGFRDRADRVDIRQVGFVYLLLTICVLGAALLLRNHALVCVGLTWVLLDPSYWLFFNSFFSEPPAFIALAGVVVWFSSGDPFAAVSARRRTSRALVLWALIIFGAFSRTPMMLFGVTVGAVLACWWARARPAWRPRLFAAITLVVVLSPLVHYQWGPAYRFPMINNFNTVFRGIAAFSGQPERALETFGIPEEHWHRIGGHFTEVPPDLAGHLHGVSRLQLAGLYLTDPGATLNGLGHAANRLADGRWRRLGNFERDHWGPRRFTRAWQFSDVRRWLFAWPWLTWIFVAAMAAWSLVRLFRDRWRSNASPVLLLLALTIASQVGVALLGDGAFALTRHLAVARLALDLMLVVAAAELVELAIPRLAKTRTLRALWMPPTSAGE